MRVYEDYHVYGPYLRKDGRMHMCMKHKVTGKRRVISFPKYLVECYLNKYLGKDDTVDHIDNDFTNNELSNLRVLSLKDHASQDAIRVKATFTCPWCRTAFTLHGHKVIDARHNRKQGKAGPFCSRSCGGKYSAAIKHHGTDRLEIKPIDNVIRHRTKLSAFEETQRVEPVKFGETLTGNADGNPEPSP